MSSPSRDGRSAWGYYVTVRIRYKKKKKERKKEKSGSIMEQPVFITMIKKLVACESQPEALRVFPDTLG